MKRQTEESMARMKATREARTRQKNHRHSVALVWLYCLLTGVLGGYVVFAALVGSASALTSTDGYLRVPLISGLCAAVYFTLLHLCTQRLVRSRFLPDLHPGKNLPLLLTACSFAAAAAVVVLTQL